MELENILYLYNNSPITETEFILQLCEALLYKDNNIRQNLRDLISIIIKSIEYIFAIDDNIQIDKIDNNNGVIKIFELNPSKYHMYVFYDVNNKSCSFVLDKDNNRYEMKVTYNSKYKDFQACYEFTQELSYIFDNDVFLKKSLKYDIDQYKASIENN